MKLERRLVADKNLGQRYSTAINEYINLGHARKLSDEESAIRPAGRTWFLSHHPVINPKKPEKCRPVFDASAYYKGTSLNSALLKGPDLLTNLIGVLLRFRHHPVALSADIVKMFHQAAEDGGADADDVTQQVIDHFYVDNWLTSFPSSEEAIHYAEKVTNVLRRGGFELAQWG